MKADSYIIHTEQSRQWEGILHRCGNYDVFHLPAYHKLGEENTDQKAELFVFETGSTVVAFPILLNQVQDPINPNNDSLFDVSSVYGYAGPISNRQVITENESEKFAGYFLDYLDQNRVVSIFSRLHPLIDQESYLNKLGGSIETVGTTITIDLTLPPEVQYKQIRKGHRYEIRKAKSEGLKVLYDKDQVYLGEFCDLYLETMSRVGASENYLFDQEYFFRLSKLLGDELHLFVVLYDNLVISGALITTCGPFVQYYLSGTNSNFLKFAPSKLIVDEARMWAYERKASFFHLGGGVGSKKDGLYRFKAGFSNLTNNFQVWKMIVKQKKYWDIVERANSYNQENDLIWADPNYFPIYRGPSLPNY